MKERNRSSTVQGRFDSTTAVSEQSKVPLALLPCSAACNTKMVYVESDYWGNEGNQPTRKKITD